MSTCDGVYDLIQLYVDGELTGHERNSFHAHIQKCTICRLKTEEAQAFSLKLKQVRRVERAPATLRESVVRLVKQHAADSDVVEVNVSPTRE